MVLNNNNIGCLGDFCFVNRKGSAIFVTDMTSHASRQNSAPGEVFEFLQPTRLSAGVIFVLDISPAGSGHGVPCPLGVRCNQLLCSGLGADTARRVPALAAQTRKLTCCTQSCFVAMSCSCLAAHEKRGQCLYIHCPLIGVLVYEDFTVSSVLVSLTRLRRR